MDKKTLHGIISAGLSENEAKVYYAMLGLSRSTVAQISSDSGIKRTTVYPLLESLMQKGLVYIEIMGLKKFYIPADPKVLENVWQQKKSLLDRVIPDLSSLYFLQGGENLVQCYEGIDAIKNLYTEVLHTTLPKDFYYVIANQERWLNLDPDFFEDFLKLRKKKRISSKMILENNEVGICHQKIQHEFFSKIKLLPSQKELTTDLVITPHKILIHQLVGRPLAIIIENKNIVQMHKEIFETLWEFIP